MRRAALLFLIAVLLVSLTSTAQAWKRPHWAQDWIRNHPFQVTAWVDDGASAPVSDEDSDIQNYRDANLNYYAFCDPLDVAFMNRIESYEAANPGASKNPLWIYMSPNEGGLVNLNNHDDNNGNPGVVFMNKDEPNTMERLIGDSAHLQNIKTRYPDWLSFTNAIGATHPHNIVIRQDDEGNDVVVSMSQDFIDYNEPDVLSSDYFPFRQGDSGTEFGHWLDYLDNIRTLGVANGLPYQTWITSEGREGSVGLNSRVPSESDFRMQYFTALAYGFKGFVSMSYVDSASNLCYVDLNGVPQDDGTPHMPDDFYDYASTINAEVFNVGEVLKYATSIGDETYVILGQVGATKNVLWGEDWGVSYGVDREWAAGIDPDDHILDVTILDDGATKNGVLGFLRADDGDELFMLTNVYCNYLLTGVQAAVDFEIVFDATVDSLLSFNNTTGATEVVALTDHTLTVNLMGGEGRLYKYNDGNTFALEGVWYMPGDVTGDGWVGGSDLTTVITNWGMTGATHADGDLSGDGTVSGPDYTAVINNWGSGIPMDEPMPPYEPGGVPEPATLALMLAGVLSGLLRRR